MQVAIHVGDGDEVGRPAGGVAESFPDDIVFHLLQTISSFLESFYLSKALFA
jgi:hypothetical protein